MACLEMYNNSNTPSQAPTMSPRISFSNDFVESSHNSQHNTTTTTSRAPPSSDFEFSVSNNSMLSADELFFKGRILPFKDNNSNNNNNNGVSFNAHMQRTLRDELLVDDEFDFSLKPPKGSSSSSSSSNRWKGFLGLRKSHIGSKKSEKSVNFDDAKRFTFLPQDANLAKISEDTMSSEGQNNSDMEMRI
ncbi:hypothetical protein RND81_11G219300 [Saponaria officinalis]|uniref:Uncharacterized protein n=1 Tax=Saponaria officinalis TaxID=3572 RepID=A0AAW1HQR9_SAPOF